MFLDGVVDDEFCLDDLELLGALLATEQFEVGVGE